MFPIVKAALLDPELENLPTDYIYGLDFRITKTSKGGFADYSTSTWSRRESALTEAERAAIEKYGLPKLSDFLPKKPSSIELQVIKEMFEASVDGMAYDPDRWAAYYRPSGMPAPQSDRKDPTAATSSAPVAPVSASNGAPWEETAQAAAESIVVPALAKVEEAAGGEDKAAAILAMIRSRQTKPA